jgi:hypothetical protein
LEGDLIVKDIGEVIKAKTSQRDQLGREIQILTQALAIMNVEEGLTPAVPVPEVKANPWP